jgi:hypothetical protein
MTLLPGARLVNGCLLVAGWRSAILAATRIEFTAGYSKLKVAHIANRTLVGGKE